MSKKSQNVFRTIRADAKKVESVLEHLDANVAPRPDETNRRTAERYEYRRKCIFVHMKQPGDVAPKRFLVEARNLSEGGIAFLHGGFIHPGALCKIWIVSMNRSCGEVEGQVVGCRYAEGGLHEVSVKFTSLIDLAQYCADATRKRVLLVDDDPSVVRLATAYLDKLNVDLDLAEDGNVAIEKATSNVYDLILMDVEMPKMDGLIATKELRKRGYTGRIVAATARTQPSDRQACLDAGCDDYITKPLTKDSLAQILDRVHQELIFSTLAGDPAMVDLVNAFVAELPARIRAIEEALIQDDWAKLELHTRTLKGDGTSYGFRILTETATAIESSLIGKSPVEQIRNQVNDLVRLCLQVRSSAHLAGLTEDAKPQADANAKPRTRPKPQIQSSDRPKRKRKVSSAADKSL